VSDPATTTSASRTARVFTPVLILLGVMWVLELADLILPADFDYWGIRSRDPEGLLGIPLAPFLHAGFDHLLANTLPFLILGTLVAWRVGGRFWSIAIVIILLGGLGVWLFGPGNVITIGASGLVFGFLGYLLAAGVLTRSWVDILVSLGVLFIYGSMLSGALPWAVPAGVSWLAHLTGALAGVGAAFMFAKPERPAIGSGSRGA
jgi:membrane associated rhomboid family serine protease